MSTDTIPQSLRFIAILRGLSVTSLSWLVQSVTQHWPSYYDVKPINIKSISNLVNTSPVYNKFHGLIYPRSVDFARHKLTTLPLDIVLDIVKELDWYSILTIRKTCKYLEEISRTCTVWCSQYRLYVAQRPFPLHLEEPLESYTAAELERWMLLRISADLGWESDDTKLTRTSQFKQKEVTGIFLVPGGRWLLVGSENGSVMAYDMDAPTVAPKLLIPPETLQDQQPVYNMSISQDLSSSKLTFTLSLSPCAQYANSLLLLRIHIWRIILHGHGAQAHLRANRLNNFQAHDVGVITRTAIHDNHFGRIIRNNARSSSIDVFDWAKSTSETHHKATIFCDETLSAIRFLPGHRLLVCSVTSLMLYSFITAKCSEVTAPTATSSLTKRLWRLPFDGDRVLHGALSEGHSDELATYFVIYAGNTIHGLAIPHIVDQPPHLRELVDISGLELGCITLSVGFEKAFIQHRDRSISRLKFSWDKRGIQEVKPASSCPTITVKGYPTTLNGARLPLLDEETGRVVQSSREGIVIVDTALLYTTDGKNETSIQSIS
ncbi:hypothetical protein Hypma_014706 [Hypsizygus marmoreus]|uniref:F-box domain-containing protein n=1 Tax=Hypsizygus marmoreus TaxID=39966 RepID=A0A369JA29_HYPMA|nr:hypothetical protein Hypma_014706 [Hypsizygus marmoreus]